MGRQAQILHWLFQSKLVKVFNYVEDISALAFISWLHVFHPLYKHLLKHDVTRMSEVMSRAQPYIQLEEAMKSSDSCQQPESGATRLQEAVVPHSLSKPTLSLQRGTTLHPAKAPHQ